MLLDRCGSCGKVDDITERNWRRGKMMAKFVFLGERSGARGANVYGG